MGKGRKRGLLILTLVQGLVPAMVGSAQAQEAAIGVRVGLNAGYTLFEVEAREAREARPGLLLGGTFAYRWRPWMSFQAEVLFSQKGWAAAEGEGGIRVSYVEVPILLRLQHSGFLQPHLLLGPTVGLEVACSFDAIGGADRVDCDHPLISMDRPTLDTGFLAGVGIGRSLGPGDFSIDALASFGFSDVIREPLPWGAQRNFALSLSLGYTFDFGLGKGGLP